MAGESQDEPPPLYGAALGHESQGSRGKGLPESQPGGGGDRRDRRTEGSAEAGGRRGRLLGRSGWEDPGAPNPEGAAPARATHGRDSRRRRRNLPRSGAGPSSQARPHTRAGRLAGSAPPHPPRSAPEPPQNLAAQPPPGLRAHPPAPPPGARWSDDTAGCVANRRGPPGGRSRTRPSQSRKPMRRRRLRPLRGERARGPAPASPRPPLGPALPARPLSPAPPLVPVAALGPPPTLPPARQRASRLPPSLSLSRLAQWRRPRRSSNSSTCS